MTSEGILHVDAEFLSHAKRAGLPRLRLHKSSGRVGELQRTEEEMDMTPWLGVLFFVVAFDLGIWTAGPRDS